MSNPDFFDDASADQTAPDGSALLFDVASFVRRFVVCMSSQAAAMALWIVHTHALEYAYTSPYLWIRAATPEAGKTRALEVLELLCARPWQVVSPTPATLFRTISGRAPTMLLDEVETVFSRSGGEALREVINAGNRRGSQVPRCGSNGIVVMYDVFCPKALAGIGKGLPSTVASRSIPIQLWRRKPDEPVERLRRRDVEPEAMLLKARITAFVREHRQELETIRPQIPNELGDRAAEGWEPLLAIAEVAGGSWPQLAAEAAVELSGPRAIEDTAEVMLVLAIEEAFEERATDRLRSTDLAQALNLHEERPWGGTIDPTRLAEILRPFDIRPVKIRVGTNTYQGYRRDQFIQVWERYR
jgi:hypothetical protein